MKKKQLQSLGLNKKVVSLLNSEKMHGGGLPSWHGPLCPGSAGQPCPSIQIPCSFADCPTVNDRTCIPQEM